MMKIFLHIGMPRTGTTFLQQDIFPEIKELHIVNLRRKNGVKFKMVSMPSISKILTNIEKYDDGLIIRELSKYYDFSNLTSSSLYSPQFLFLIPIPPAMCNNRRGFKIYSTQQSIRKSS